jgi:hypothetical protein
MYIVIEQLHDQIRGVHVTTGLQEAGMLSKKLTVGQSHCEIFEIVVEVAIPEIKITNVVVAPVNPR